MTIGIWLLDVMITVSGTLFFLAAVGALGFYLDSSSRAELYRGVPYHATTFRVISVQYSPPVVVADGPSTGPIASAVGIVEGQRESMDLLPYIFPRDRSDLMERFPEGTVIPVYLFPTLSGVNRIQRIGVSPSQKFQRQSAWASNRALPLVGGMGMLLALLILWRFFLSRNRTPVSR